MTATAWYARRGNRRDACPAPGPANGPSPWPPPNLGRRAVSFRECRCNVGPYCGRGNGWNRRWAMAAPKPAACRAAAGFGLAPDHGPSTNSKGASGRDQEKKIKTKSPRQPRVARGLPHKRAHENPQSPDPPESTNNTRNSVRGGGAAPKRGRRDDRQRDGVCSCRGSHTRHSEFQRPADAFRRGARRPRPHNPNRAAPVQNNHLCRRKHAKPALHGRRRPSRRRDG